MAETIAGRRKRPLLFTSFNGEEFELKPEDLPRDSLLHPHNIRNSTMDEDPIQPTLQNLDLPIRTMDGPSEKTIVIPGTSGYPRSFCGAHLIEVRTSEEMPIKQSLPISRKGESRRYRSKTGSGSLGPQDGGPGGPKVHMSYNEYGELVETSSINEHPTPDQLTVTQLLRVIKKAYHHDLWKKLSLIVNPTPDGGPPVLSEDNIWPHVLSSWDLRLQTPKSTSQISKANPNSPATGQRRALGLGACDGDWCFAFNKQQLDWIVNGVDDTDHWSCVGRDVPLRDFMRTPDSTTENTLSDYFPGVTSSLSYPEFTKRNLNCLLNHEKPLPQNYYEFVRARSIFDRIESYKTFLEEIRCLLKPDGVVEFIEVDPRPRITRSRTINETLEAASAAGKKGKKLSTEATDWTDKIEDRFKDPLDRELATDLGWSRRVAERLKANLRPQDGFAAANLKSWLEGAGFWDVKQYVLPIPVGGNTKSGRLLKEYLLYQLELENCIPKLCEELPEVEVAEMETGKYFLNVHVVTGRKSMDLRPGDLMPNGDRKEITQSTYHTMARFDAIKSSQWKRFDLEGTLTSIMQNLTKFTGVSEALQVPHEAAEDGLMPIIGRHPDFASPFQAPPFVTLNDMEDHISGYGLENDARSELGRTGSPREE